MPGYLAPAIGLALLLLSALLVTAVATGRTAWMHRLLGSLPGENHDDETASPNVEFTALVIGILAGVIGFFFLAGSFVSLIV